MGYVFFLIKHILDIPKTIWFNFKVLPINKAIRFPIFISRRVKLNGIKRGCIKVPENSSTFMVKIGIEGVEGISGSDKGYISIVNGGCIVFKGRASLGRGISIRCSSGKIVFGNNFYANCNLSLISTESIEFGNNNLLGWNVNIRDCDGHKIYQDGQLLISQKAVSIGDNVWIAAFVDILKGVNIRYGSIVAYRSCVLKPFDKENILIAGYPAKIAKEGVSWEI